MFFTIIIALVTFLFIILILVGILLLAKKNLSNSGLVDITINDEKFPIQIVIGDTLLSALSKIKIFLPSACGGSGTCLQCKCQVISGGGSLLATEEPHFSKKEIEDHWRLGCQVKIKENLSIYLPKTIFGIKRWQAEVISNYNVSSFIKEFIIRIPKNMNYQAGGYIQITVPKYKISYQEIDISAHPKDHPNEPMKFKKEWDNFNLWDLKIKNEDIVERAYSMASYPSEGRDIMLNVRIATPPWDYNTKSWVNVNPGIASSYIFSRKPGDKVTISGPYGDFIINKNSDSEMIYIGGGAGMAPMRSHIYELFHTMKTTRKVTYWYGGRSKRELFYIHYFKNLELQFPNFKFYIVLSDPHPEDNWKVKKDLKDKNGDGFTGFVHQALIENYLKYHETPEDIEFYFCGPPMMNKAIINMCNEFGVPKENIRFDDFGSG